MRNAFIITSEYLFAAHIKNVTLWINVSEKNVKSQDSTIKKLHITVIIEILNLIIASQIL